MEQLDLGKVSVTPKGEWVQSEAYEFLDIVTHEGGSYLAAEDIPAGSPLSAWLPIAEKGAKGDKGNKGDTGDRGYTGNGIESVELISTSGSEKTYCITFTDGNTFEYVVTDGEVTEAAMTAALALKADKDDVEASLALKANSSDVEDALELKANTTNVNTALALKADKAALAAANHQIDLLKAAAQGKLWTTDTDTELAYSKVVDAGTMAAEVESIGGRSIVMNQRYNPALGDSPRTSYGISFLNNEDGSWTLSGEATGTNAYANLNYRAGTQRFTDGHKYLIRGATGYDRVRMAYFGVYTPDSASSGHYLPTSATGPLERVFEVVSQEESSYIRLQVRAEGASIEETVYPEIIDLTQMFGETVAATITTPADAYALGCPRGHIAYDTGTLVHADVDKVVSSGMVMNQQAQGGDFAAVPDKFHMNATVAGGVITCTVNEVLASDWYAVRFTLPCAFVKDHRYLFSCDVMPVDKNQSIYMSIQVLNYKKITATMDVWNSLRGIVDSTVTKSLSSRYMWVIIHNSTAAAGDVVKFRNVMVFDLTQMFGETVAAAITTPEDAYTLGCPREYTPYNAGTLIVPGEMPIPAAVRALEGYGQSVVGGSANTVDFDAKTYTEYGHYVDGEWVAEADPQPEDISALLEDVDTLLDIEKRGYGQITFHQSGSELPVPNKTTAFIKIEEALSE